LDIDGAKALEERLGRNGAAKPRPASGDMPEGAPPIYRWFAVRSSVDEAASAESGLTPGQDGLGLPSTS
jgi:hypothetical protein